MHVHAHGAHSHGDVHHEGHSHVHSIAGPMTLILGVALAANLILVIVEFTAAYFGHSIALAGDGVHNLTDLPTLALSWLATRWATRPPTPEKTYGYHRAGILSAFVNALLLSLVSIFIFYEAYRRLLHPAVVESGVMLWVAILALVINGGIALALVQGKRDLNLRAVLVHSFGDALSNIAIIGGALAIRWTNFNRVDPIIGILIGVLVLWSAVGILRESIHILLEGLPRDIELQAVAKAILGVEGVQEVHDVHIWTLGTDLQVLSCHVKIPDMHMEESERILTCIQALMAERFKILHTTIQFERAGLPGTGLYMPEPLTRG